VFERFFGKKNLILSVVGDDSRHREWVNEESSFDLALIYYGQQKNRYLEDSTYYLQKSGYKWNLIADFIDLHPSILKQYQYVWCPDDDIQVNSYVVNMLFRYFKHYKMDIAQPSLTDHSHRSHSITLHRENVILRYTNFVEIMMPLFSVFAFNKVFHTFRESNSCWGCDWIWPKLMDYKNCGIIDAVVVTHEKRNGDLFKKYESDRVFPEDEAKENMKQYNIMSKVCIELSSIGYLLQKKRCSVQIKGISNPDNFAKLSRPCRRANKCSVASDELSHRFTDLRVLK